MNVTWLRQLARIYGPVGLLIAGLLLGVYWLWKRAPLVLLALAVAFALFIFVYTGKSNHLPPGDAEGYSITDLGALPGGTVFIPTGINGRRQVAGYADIPEEDENGDPILHAALWQAGRLRDLGAFGGIDSYAGRLNDAGQVAVTVRFGQRDFRAFLWDGGRGVPLPGAGGPFTAAYMVNNRGQVAGTAYKTGDRGVQAVYWDREQLVDPGMGAKCRASEGVGINDSGLLAGSMLVDRQIKGFTWQNGGLRPLRPLRGPLAVTFALNNRGQAVGASTIAEGDPERFHAVLWSSGNPRDLGGFRGKNSIAEDVNDSGTAAGVAEVSRDEWHAVIWRDGRIVDLNSQIPGGRGWTLLAATTINNRGDVAGVGVKDGGFHGFLLIVR